MFILIFRDLCRTKGVGQLGALEPLFVKIDPVLRLKFEIPVP